MWITPQTPPPLGGLLCPCLSRVVLLPCPLPVGPALPALPLAFSAPEPGKISLLCLSAWSREQKTVLQSTSHLTPHQKRVGLLWRHATGQSCLSGRKDTTHSGLHRGDRLTGKACRCWRGVLHAGHVQENDSCKRIRVCSGQ